MSARQIIFQALIAILKGAWRRVKEEEFLAPAQNLLLLIKSA